MSTGEPFFPFLSESDGELSAAAGAAAFADPNASKRP
jgi:hypothetical protein